MSFTVAIIGRPNVGKSTLFNRLVGRKIALVDDTPGVTRDRRVHAAKLYDLQFDVVDTAGFETAAPESLQGRMRQQTDIAIREADLIIFMIDARAGLLPDDKTFADIVRRAGKPVVLVANKSEARSSQAGVLEGWEAGLGEPVSISAEHGQGMPDLRDAIVELLGEARCFGEEDEEDDDAIADTEVLIGEDVADPDAEPGYDDTKPMRIAVVGRPNAGKSTLINALIGEERLLTGPEAGITRDSISVDWEWRGRKLRLFDTAGMRRKAKVQEKLEKLSVVRRPARHPLRRGRGHRLRRDDPLREAGPADRRPDHPRGQGAGHRLQQVGHDRAARSRCWPNCARRPIACCRRCAACAPCRSRPRPGRGLDKLMEAIISTHQTWNRRISTGKLNRWLEGILGHHPPPAVAGRRLKIKYMTQAKTRPPGFVVSCTRPDAVPESYIRYLVNNLREDFDMPGVPIRMAMHASENPYAAKAKKRRLG